MVLNFFYENLLVAPGDSGVWKLGGRRAVWGSAKKNVGAQRAQAKSRKLPLPLWLTEISATCAAWLRRPGSARIVIPVHGAT